MTALAERLRRKYFKGDHPYRTFELEVERRVRKDAVLLDAGCGRTAPILTKFKGKAGRLIGVDLVDFVPGIPDVELFKHDLGAIPLPSASVDLVMSRSVMEHIGDPRAVYGEIHRILKPGGHFIFLTANFWDYASIIAAIVPNRFHPYIVSRTEGRAEQDVFPIAYRTNTRRSVARWSKEAGFEIVSFAYLGQYPAYFMFNGFAFLLATGYQKLIENVPGLGFLQGWILATLRKPEATARAASPEAEAAGAATPERSASSR